VFLLETGECGSGPISDHEIIAAFETEHAAREFAKREGIWGADVRQVAFFPQRGKAILPTKIPE